MPLLKRLHKIRDEIYRILLPLLFLHLSLITFHPAITAQSCPPNIDFEKGTFDGWTCYTGITQAVGNQNQILLNATSGPVYGHHTMYSGNGGVDPFGGFPVNCPNGSGHSIRLGSTQAGGEAEGVSYEFTIPANNDSYTLTYNYAVVFQSPNHQDFQQPRMQIEITNVTDNTTISCASYSFIAVGSGLPGFKVSNVTDTITVLYKEWSPVTVDLSGNAGKTIRLFFKTADCTFRRHFGYGYVDVNSECSGSFVGATFCPDDKEINVAAPYGYASYTWYDSALTRTLGSEQLLHLSPPPPSGTTVAVRLEPYNGYGCSNTMFTTLRDSLTITANAGADGLSCNMSPVPIGAPSKTGLKYAWSPPDGLDNPNISNPLASPGKTTTYIVATSNSGGGCLVTDTVTIRASIIDDSLQLIGKAAYCLNNNDSAILHVNPTTSIEWFKDDILIPRATNQTRYKVNSSGTYYALLKNLDGCSVSTIKQPVFIDIAKPGIMYPVEYALSNAPLPLQARPIGETVLWIPAINLDAPKSFMPTFTGLREQLYIVSILTKTECLTIDTQMVKIIKSVEIYVPTAFTPNNDGKNDLLRPILIGLKDLHYFRVFNRWGQLLYEAKKPMEGWDGMYKGVPQQTQTVVWMVEGTGIDNVVHTQKGTTVLLR
ncbi:MAG: gliding motility-associated C-terminal domain-containing protein [Bacteroidota bacterium]|nr:gliding motility-associated C-terminal domain-containing protein [Bacteroidota bacterium]